MGIGENPSGKEEGERPEPRSRRAEELVVSGSGGGGGGIFAGKRGAGGSGNA